MSVMVYVVMGNDYPDAVFRSKESAEKYVAAKKAEQDPKAVRIYWRWYEFELKD